MNNAEHWWQRPPLNICAIQRFVEEGSECAFDEYVSKYGFNTEQLNHLLSNGYIAYYEEEKHGERLDSYLKKSRKAGIREIVYTNVHCLNEELGDTHPEFWQFDKNGDPILAYNAFYMTCVNPNGAFHKNFIENLKKLCSHDIDGIFLDGPVMRADGCFCQVCQRDFKKKFGHSIYEATPIERHRMRVDSVTGHIKEAYEVVKSMNPEILIYMNNSALRPDITGSNTRCVYNYVDMLGAEGGFFVPRLGAEHLWQTSAFMKHLEGIIGNPLTEKKPMVNFFSGNESGIRSYVHTPAETRLMYARTLANGGNVWYGLHLNVFDAIKTEALDELHKMNDFVLSYKDLFGYSKTCARVAVMWSENTANYYSSSVAKSDFTDEEKSVYELRGDHRGALLSVSDMLERLHIQFDIIDETSIERGALSSYEAVIFPSVACFSKENAERIREYVQNGGNILANFDIGTYDEYGMPLGRSRLSSVFGFESEPDIFTTQNAFMFKELDTPLLDELSMSRIPSPGLDVKWSFAPDTEVLMTTSPPCQGVYSKIPDGERYPSVVAHSYGKGRAYYISGCYLEAAIERNINDYKYIVKRFCELSTREVVVTDGAGLYEVVLRRQENRFLVHLVNLTGAMTRPIERTAPLYDLEFRLDLSGFGIDARSFKCKTVRGGSLFDISQSGDRVSFRLDRLSEYEIIVIE